MKSRFNSYAAPVLAAVLAAPAVCAAISFDDIHFWTGSGTNRAAVVIDWNSGAGNDSLVWGYRWNGQAPNMTSVLREIAAEDNRLRLVIPQSTYGSTLETIAYDANDNGCEIDSSSMTASDPDDFAGFGPFTSDSYWASMESSVQNVPFEDCVLSYSMSGIDGVYARNGGWFSYKFINWMIGEDSYPAAPSPAPSPYGFKIRDCAIGGLYTLYDVPENALGRPTDYMDFEYGGVVSPVNPAWGEGSLLTLDSPDDVVQGYVTIEFDHNVYDDPANPFGVDFIVFGNAMQGMRSSSGYVSANSDPNTVTATDYFASEPASVAVSQDGITWFEFKDGPFADEFAPTLGRLYDEENPDASLFDGNLWWGARADATLPVDPSLSYTNFVGCTLAGYARLYNGSAGGTGYDISQFPELPADETGRKWFRYVRITNAGNIDDGVFAEVDAVSDVAPARYYDNWIRQNYSWDEIPDGSKTGPEALCANGLPNFVNAAMGLSRDSASVPDVKINGISIKDGRAAIDIPCVPQALDIIRIECAASLGKIGSGSRLVPQYDSASGKFLIPVDSGSSAGFFRLVLTK